MSSCELKQLVKMYYENQYHKVTPIIDELVLEVLNPSKEEERLGLISEEISMNLNQIKMLNVGCGFASFNMLCYEKGIDCCGIEPELSVIKGICLRGNHDNDNLRKICRSVGEHLPFRDEVFDLVVSFQVLEHTTNPRGVLEESIRVLKKGGYLYFNFPNYKSFWEPHYGLFWIPCFPRPLAKIYLRALNRNPEFLDTIQYLTPKRISKTLIKQDVEVLSWGVELWEKRIDSLAFTPWGNTKKLQHLVSIIHRFKMTTLIKYLGRKFALYYPVVLVCQKK